MNQTCADGYHRACLNCKTRLLYAGVWLKAQLTRDLEITYPCTFGFVMVIELESCLLVLTCIGGRGFILQKHDTPKKGFFAPEETVNTFSFQSFN